MKTTKRGLGESLRIIWAIAFKDILDALKNKTTLTSFLLVFFLMAFYKFLPSLWTGSDTDIVVYDAGNSTLTAALESSPAYDLRRVDSFQEFEEFFNDGDEGPLGLIVPVDFDQTLESGGQPELSGYILWDRRYDQDDLQAEYEERMSDLLGVPVSVQIEGTIYQAPEAMGAVRITALSFLLLIVMMGTLTVPHLMFEEKRTRTLDVMLVSPASYNQVVMGKALAGMFYILVVAAAVLAFNWTYVVSWGLTLLAILGGSLLSVGIGLSLGLLLDNKAQLNTWSMILFQPLLIPAFLSMIDPLFPEAVRNILSYIPTVSLTLLFRYAFTDGATASQIGLMLGIVTGTALLALSVVVWLVGRRDR